MEKRISNEYTGKSRHPAAGWKGKVHHGAAADEPRHTHFNRQDHNGMQGLSQRREAGGHQPHTLHQPTSLHRLPLHLHSQGRLEVCKVPRISPELPKRQELHSCSSLLLFKKCPIKSVCSIRFIEFLFPTFVLLILFDSGFFY